MSTWKMVRGFEEASMGATNARVFSKIVGDLSGKLKGGNTRFCGPDTSCPTHTKTLAVRQ
jgi:hypothetical protein